MRLGLSFIATVLAHNRPECLLWLEESDFIEIGAKAYSFVRDFYEKYKELPTKSQVENSIEHKLPDESGAIEFFRDEILKRSKIFRLNRAVAQAQKELQNREPEEAQSVLTNILIEEARAKDTCSLFTKNTELFQLYDDQKKGKIVYLSTPWQSLNDQIKGWEVPSFNVIAGITGAGKSWASCVIAEDRYQKGDDVLLVTMEMPRIKILRRLYCIRYKLPFTELLRAELTAEQEDMWIKSFAEDSKRDNEFHIFDKKIVRTVADILVLVNTYHPRIVIVDGGYILEGKGDNSWSKQVSVIRDIQRAAEETELPWVVTTQMGSASEKGKKRLDAARSWNTRYAREWETDPDIVLSLGDNQDLRLMRQVEWRLIKFREMDDVQIKPFRVWLDKQTPRFDEVEEVSTDVQIDVPF